MLIGRFFRMKYIVGTNQKTKLYTARFLFSRGYFIYNTHNVVNGIASHNIKPTASGIYGHNILFVEVLRNISSLYSTLLAFDTRYGDKIRIASSRNAPPGIKSITSCAINTGIEGSIKNIKFQKLSLFMREAIKPAFGIFGISNSNCLALFLNLKGLVKSSIFNTYYRFNILELILPRIRTLFKIITCATLCLFIFILGNTRAYGADNTPSNPYLLKKYSGYVERKNRIPRGLLSAIVAVESGFNPYSVNITGKSFVANNKLEAVKTIKNALNQGITNIDIGIAQINYRWHKDNFKNIEEMLSPATNIEYAAKLLSSLFKRHGTWQDAIKYYHSANSDYHRQYSRKVVTAWLGNTYLLTIK